MTPFAGLDLLRQLERGPRRCTFGLLLVGRLPGGDGRGEQVLQVLDAERAQVLPHVPATIFDAYYKYR